MTEQAVDVRSVSRRRPWRPMAIRNLPEAGCVRATLSRLQPSLVLAWRLMLSLPGERQATALRGLEPFGTCRPLPLVDYQHGAALSQRGSSEARRRAPQLVAVASAPHAVAPHADRTVGGERRVHRQVGGAPPLARELAPLGERLIASTAATTLRGTGLERTTIRQRSGGREAERRRARVGSRRRAHA